MFHRMCAGLAVVVFASAANAQLNYDPPHPGPTASFRDYGMIIEQFNRTGDEADFYEELPSALGPASINKVFEYTTQDGDKGTTTVQFNSDADSDSITFAGSASALITGNSANIDTAFATAYTAQQWLFDVAQPTQFTVEGTIGVIDNSSGSTAFFRLDPDTGPALFDYTVDDDETLNLTGANKFTTTLQPGTIYTLLLDVFSYNGTTPGQTGSVSFDVTATVPEPASVAAGLAAMLLGRRRWRSRQR